MSKFSTTTGKREQTYVPTNVLLAKVSQGIISRDDSHDGPTPFILPFQMTPTGVQVPLYLQTVSQLPIFCLLHYLALSMAHLTIAG